MAKNSTKNAAAAAKGQTPPAPPAGAPDPQADPKEKKRFRVDRATGEDLNELMRRMSEAKSYYTSANVQVINLVGAAQSYHHADDKRVQDRAEARADEAVRAIRMYLKKAAEELEGALAAIS